MKQSKSEITQHRQRLLIVIALVLGLLAGFTGYLGFVYIPAEDDFSDADPTQVTETQALPEDPFGSEPTQATDIPAIPGESTEAQTLPEETFSPDPAQTEGTQTLPVDDADPNLAQPEDGQDLPGGNPDPTQPTAGQDMPIDGVASAPAQTEYPVPPGESDPTTLPSEETAPFQPTVSESLPPSDQEPAQRDMLSEMHPHDTEDSTPSTHAKSWFRLCMRIACCIFLTAWIADIALLLVLRKNIRDHEERKSKKMDSTRPAKAAPIPITLKNVEQPFYPIPGISLGKVHNMGKREYQQDSFGQSPILEDSGILAVLADGMGGLSNGERVSQKIIMEALNFAVALQPDQIPSALPDMVEKVNRAVNQMLGPSGLYTSGSTLVSALMIKGALWWISVGDSRIYLYRDQHLNQLSRDHDLFQDWMGEILDGKRSMEESVNNPDGRKLTSFIGMGELRYVDRNRAPIPLLPGDRVLLMSDGIYGTVSDAEMARILQSCANVQEAASQIAQKISAANLPYQDNYTLVILGYDPPEKPSAAE